MKLCIRRGSFLCTFRLTTSYSEFTLFLFCHQQQLFYKASPIPRNTIFVNQFCRVKIAICLRLPYDPEEGWRPMHISSLLLVLIPFWGLNELIYLKHSEYGPYSLSVGIMTYVQCFHSTGVPGKVEFQESLPGQTQSGSVANERF